MEIKIIIDFNNQRNPNYYHVSIGYLNIEQNFMNHNTNTTFAGILNRISCELEFIFIKMNCAMLILNFISFLVFELFERI